MNYALKILEAEKRLQEWHINRLEKKVWSPMDDIPPTIADRKRKLKDIENAIEKLKV